LLCGKRIQSVKFLRVFLIVATGLALVGVSAEFVRVRAARARYAAVSADLLDLQEKLRDYYMDNDRYPSSEEGLAALFSYPAEREDPGILLPKRPALPRVVDRWGNSYFYNSDGERYVLGSYGPRGNAGRGSDPALTVRSPDIPR
jgi:general secretion pathway protein G